MSHARTSSVTCDGGHRPGAVPCQKKYGWHGVITVRDGNAYVRAKGWHVRPDGRHICPDCWKAGAR